MLFCVSDWSNDEIVEAGSSLEAAIMLTGDVRLRAILPSELSGATVVCAMCAPYEGWLEATMETCRDDMARVLILDSFESTEHFTPQPFGITLSIHLTFK
ncbi:hypothetical protein [Vibrio sp. CB1-14]|uniref:Uncharacterized protein n=1 Tax=Vibrio chaetopteri TaxID=3016528 RepID=A0AAU8BN83_9VIBR